jgi:hypothetical protein
MVLLFDPAVEIADRLERAAVVEPVDPYERRELGVIEVLPKTAMIEVTAPWEASVIGKFREGGRHEWSG